MSVRCSIFISLVALWAFAVFAPPSAAQDTGDPSAGSPAGAVYELPFEKGRRDAAPKGDGDAGAGGPGSDGSSAGGEASGAEGAELAEGADGADGSLFRTENNFGSSSRVPGSGDAGADAGEEAIAGALTADSDAGDPSPARSYGLLALIALAGAGIGLAIRRQHTA